MITQQLLVDIKSHEEYFFSFFRVPPTTVSPDKVSPDKISPDKVTVAKNGGNSQQETPLIPSQVDKIVKKALNQLKAKQDLIKKRNSGLTAEAAKTNAGKGKRKAGEGDASGEDGAVGAKKKKKKVDKLDKKERRKVDLKGRSAKKDVKNKAVKEGKKEGVTIEDSSEEAALSSAENLDSVNGKKDQFMFGKIETAGKEGKKKQMGKDFKRHLKTLQDEKSKIAQAKGEDREKGEELEEKFAWKNMLQKAQGVKVKDDEGLIKKSIRRKENIKKHSQKKWENREKEVKEKMAEKQKKRTANIRAKKDEKIKKKVKKMTKKGRLVPGLNAPDV